MNEGAAPNDRRPAPSTRNASPKQEGRGYVTRGERRPRVHPHHRDHIPPDRPPRFYEHGRHYYGYRVHRLPPRYDVHYHWGHRYFCHNGIYYRYRGGVYYVSRPPYGYWFEPSLYHYHPTICRIAYYSYVDRQYDIINDNYETIAEQNALIARNNSTIASQQQVIESQQRLQQQMSSESYQLAMQLGLIQSYAAVGQEYYFDDGVFFVTNSNGKYETIVPPAGALVDQLPDDYEIVTLRDGKEYFKVDDTIYRMTVSDGKAYFEVLGQLQD